MCGIIALSFILYSKLEYDILKVTIMTFSSELGAPDADSCTSEDFVAAGATIANYDYSAVL